MRHRPNNNILYCDYWSAVKSWTEFPLIKTEACSYLRWPSWCDHLVRLQDVVISRKFREHEWISAQLLRLRYINFLIAFLSVVYTTGATFFSFRNILNACAINWTWSNTYSISSFPASSICHIFPSVLAKSTEKAWKILFRSDDFRVTTLSVINGDHF